MANEFTNWATTGFRRDAASLQYVLDHAGTGVGGGGGSGIPDTVHDGVADDTADIQAAIDAVALAGGGIVDGAWFTYGVDASVGLSMKTNVALVRTKLKRVGTYVYGGNGHIINNADTVGGNPGIILDVEIDGGGMITRTARNGTVTSGSATITALADTSDIVVGMFWGATGKTWNRTGVGGGATEDSAKVLSKTSSTITLDGTATSSGTGISTFFDQSVSLDCTAISFRKCDDASVRVYIHDFPGGGYHLQDCNDTDTWIKARKVQRGVFVPKADCYVGYMWCDIKAPDGADDCINLAADNTLDTWPKQWVLEGQALQGPHLPSGGNECLKLSGARDVKIDMVIGGGKTGSFIIEDGGNNKDRYTKNVVADLQISNSGNGVTGDASVVGHAVTIDSGGAENITVRADAHDTNGALFRVNCLGTGSLNNIKLSGTGTDISKINVTDPAIIVRRNSTGKINKLSIDAKLLRPRGAAFECNGSPQGDFITLKLEAFDVNFNGNGSTDAVKLDGFDVGIDYLRIRRSSGVTNKPRHGVNVVSGNVYSPARKLDILAADLTGSQLNGTLLDTFDTSGGGSGVVYEAPLRADDPAYAGDLTVPIGILNAMAAGSSGVLYVPPSDTYVPLTAPLAVTHDRITIKGDGKPSVIEAGGNLGHFFDLDGAVDFTIQDINLICLGDPPKGESAFTLDDSQDFQAFNVDMEGIASVVKIGLVARSQRSKWINIHGTMRPEADDDWWQIYDSAETRLSDCHLTANSGICRAGAAILFYPGLTGRSDASVDPFKLTGAQMWAQARDEVSFVYHDAGVTNATISYDGQTTGNVAGMTAAQVKTALEALSNIGVGDVATSGGPMGTARVEIIFQGALAGNTERVTMTKVAGTGYVRAHPAGRAYGVRWEAEGWSTNNQYLLGFEADDTTIAAYYYRGDSTLDESRNFWIGPSRHATKGGRVFDIEHSGGGNDIMQGFRAFGHWTYGSASKEDEAFRFVGQIQGVDLHDATLLERNYGPGVDYVGTFACDDFNIHDMEMIASDNGDTLAANKVWRTTADVENFQIHHNPGPNPASGTYIEHYAYANDKRSRIVENNGGQKDTEQISASSTLALIPCIDKYVVTGGSTITAISTGYAGREISLRFSAAASLKASATLILSGDLIGGPGRLITLRSDGTNWYELSRSPTNTAIYATADQALTTDAAYLNDPELKFQMNINEKYYFDLILDISGPSVTPDLKVDWNLQAGMTVKWHREAALTSVTTANAPTALSTGSVTAGLDANESIHKFSGYITSTSTAGVVIVKLGQNTADAGVVTRKAGSMLKLQRMP